MKTIKKAIFLASMLIVSTSIMFAQTATPRTTATQVNQQARIKEGVRSGELTRKEATRLVREQKRIQTEKRIAKADGVVTPAERRHLKREQKRASKHIAKQKHDTQERIVK